jgi:ubiquinone biosynthesis protein
MNDQIGWRALVRHMKDEAPAWAATLPQLPRLVHQALASEKRDDAARAEIARLAAANTRQRRWLMATGLVLAGLAALEAWRWLA